MTLVIGSCFRHASQVHLDRYVAQVAALQVLAQTRGDRLSVISVWGDEDGDTPERLGRGMIPLRLATWALIDRTHGRGVFGSTTHPDRLAGFAYAGNGVFEHIPASADVVIYVESDLIWQADTLYRLVDQLAPGVEVIAPMTMAGDAHYDTWGVRWPNGIPLGPFPAMTTPTEMSSVGSCLVMRGEVARVCRNAPEDAVVGFCRQARRLGYRIWIDPRERIQHP